ncbi:MAG: respiratory nitrate reductase subunit gamma [Pseudomonadota bacterium]
MTLTPAPKGSMAGAILAETVFFPGLFKSDRVLWLFSWFFHATLALIVLGHVRVVTGVIDQTLIAMGMSAEGVDWMSSTFGGAAGIIILATGIMLLVRRFVVARAREISGTGDFFALLLIIAIILTGNLMRFGGEHFDLVQTRIWASSLLTFSPVVPVSQTFLIHALLAQVLFIYIPFSKILHFGGIFFTQALIKRS